MNKILVLLAAFFAITAARPSLEQLDTYTFEQYVKEYNLSFKEDELPQRRALFQSEIQRIKAHNARNSSWKEGVNKFTVMTAAEKKAFFGHSKALGRSQKKSLKSARKLPEDFVLKSVSELPKHVDWRESGIVGPVKDQGHCGSCWAFASTATIESHVAKASGYLYDLSIQQVIVLFGSSYYDLIPFVFRLLAALLTLTHVVALVVARELPLSLPSTTLATQLVYTRSTNTLTSHTSPRTMTALFLLALQSLPSMVTFNFLPITTLH